MTTSQADRTIRAVVLEIDSPGGDVTATEEIYYRLLQLREHKPLVVTVDYLAASGGYYMAAAGDYVYAKPASLVGNVGVISFLPPVDQQRYTDEDYVSTGPFKFSGGSRGDYVRQIELAKAGFLESVFAQRGDKLQIDREALSSGEIFMGLQAVQLGLVDDLGANSEAVREAARRAKVAHYRVKPIDHAVDDPSEEELWVTATGLSDWIFGPRPGMAPRALLSVCRVSAEAPVIKKRILGIGMDRDSWSFSSFRRWPGRSTTIGAGMLPGPSPGPITRPFVCPPHRSLPWSGQSPSQGRGAW